MKNDNKNVEAYIAELNDIATKLNDPGISLAQAVELYKQGIEAASRAQELLSGYQQEVEVLNNTTDSEGGFKDE